MSVPLLLPCIQTGRTNTFTPSSCCFCLPAATLYTFENMNVFPTCHFDRQAGRQGWTDTAQKSVTCLLRAQAASLRQFTPPLATLTFSSAGSLPVSVWLPHLSFLSLLTHSISFYSFFTLAFIPPAVSLSSSGTCCIFSLFFLSTLHTPPTTLPHPTPTYYYPPLYLLCVPFLTVLCGTGVFFSWHACRHGRSATPALCHFTTTPTLPPACYHAAAILAATALFSHCHGWPTTYHGFISFAIPIFLSLGPAFSLHLLCEQTEEGMTFPHTCSILFLKQPSFFRRAL